MKIPWETLAQIAVILALLLTGINIYLNYFRGPNISIQSFPSELDLYQSNIDENISFSFNLYNSGGKTAFVEYIFINQILGVGNELNYLGAQYFPEDSFYINPGETKEVNITLPAPHSKEIINFRVSITYYPEQKYISSEIIPARWDKYF
jgi:hypothetical protein